MNILKYTDRNYSDKIREMIERSSLFDPEIEQRTREIITLVRDKGDEALLELTSKFSNARISKNQIAITKAELVNAMLQVPETLQAVIEETRKNIILFGRRGKPRNWSIKNRHGAIVGEKFDPIQRVGIYVPGGTAPLVSTAIMTVTLAKLAGCKEIVVCTPCDSSGAVNPILLHAIWSSGATEVYRIGGAQAIAAMALGTESIKPVLKIFGPGNAYVVCAKRLLFGHVAIDLLPGPSELLVLADDSANPDFIAADMLAQAEHGSGHERVWLLTPSGSLLRRVANSIQKQLQKAVRGNYVKEVLQTNAWLVQTRSMEEAIDIANRIAPEHCEIHTKNPNKLVQKITTAGAIFVGNWTPTAVGDYVAGPNHTLPTGGAGRALSGLSIEQFYRKTSVIQYSRQALQKAFGPLKLLAETEGLMNHSFSAEIRLKNLKQF